MFKFKNPFKKAQASVTGIKKILGVTSQKKQYKVRFQVIHKDKALPAYVEVIVEAYSRAQALGEADTEIEFKARNVRKAR